MPSSAQLQRIRDPLTRAKKGHEAVLEARRLLGELADLTSAAVAELREQGWTWTELGQELGVTRARAQAIGRRH